MKLKKIRLFIASQLPRQWTEALDKYTQTFTDKNVNWIKKENWHLTHHFLGDTPVNKISQLISHLEKIAHNHHSFTLNLQKITLVSKQQTPKMIWVQFEHSQDYQKLHKDIFQATKLFSIHPPKYRTPLPHITLARLKNPPKFKQTNNSLTSRKLKIESFQLFSSQLNPTGSIYKILSNFKLNTKK